MPEARHAGRRVADTGNLFGALEFSSACADAGIQPIIGVQLGIRRDADPRGPAARDGTRRPDPDQLVLLAQNETGYGNLLKLVSKSYLETEPGEAPQVELSDVEARSAGLIAFTGGRPAPSGAFSPRGRRTGPPSILTGFPMPSTVVFMWSFSVMAWRWRIGSSPSSSISPMPATFRSSPPTNPSSPTKGCTPRTTR